jgi:adenylosuccinate synthase
VAYESRGKRIQFPPNDAEELLHCRPLYRKFPGWQTPTSGVRSFKKLPPAAQNYLKALAELTGAKLRIVSVGAQRAETFLV